MDTTMFKWFKAVKALNISEWKLVHFINLRDISITLSHFLPPHITYNFQIGNWKCADPFHKVLLFLDPSKDGNQNLWLFSCLVNIYLWAKEGTISFKRSFYLFIKTFANKSHSSVEVNIWESTGLLSDTATHYNLKLENVFGKLCCATEMRSCCFFYSNAQTILMLCSFESAIIITFVQPISLLICMYFNVIPWQVLPFTF